MTASTPTPAEGLPAWMTDECVEAAVKATGLALIGEEVSDEVYDAACADNPEEQAEAARVIRAALLAAAPFVETAARAAAAPPAVAGPGGVRVIELGRGAFVINNGTYGDRPAVFLAPAKEPGPIGASAAREGHARDELQPDETVLVFETAAGASVLLEEISKVVPAVAGPVTVEAIAKVLFARGPFQCTWEEAAENVRAMYRDDARPVLAILPAPGPSWQDGAEASAAARDVLAERRRQVDVEGWSSDHDDNHTRGEIALAAAAYAANSAAIRELWFDSARPLWPWHWSWWKPKGRRRDLVRAGALIIAEIERLDRALPLPLPPGTSNEEG